MGFFKDMWDKHKKAMNKFNEATGVNAINRRVDNFFEKIEAYLEKLGKKFSGKKGKMADAIPNGLVSSTQAHKSREASHKANEPKHKTNEPPRVMPMTKEEAMDRVTKARARQSEMQGRSDYADTVRTHTQNEVTTAKDLDLTTKQQINMLSMPNKARGYD